jgi:PST family polysaccharide transporter
MVTTVMGGFRLVLIVLEAPLEAFAWMVLGEQLIGGFLVSSHAVRGGIIWSRPDSLLASRLFGMGFPMMVSSFLSMAYMRLDQLMLEHYSGPSQVGVYAMAIRIGEAWLFIPAALAATSLPKLAAAKGDAVAFEKAAQDMYDLVASVGIGIGVFVVLMTPVLCYFLLGDSYSEIPKIMPLIAASGVIMGLGMARTQHLTVLETTRFHLVTTTAGLAVNVALNLMLIPLWGAMGAATATVVSQWTVVHGMSYLHPAIRPSGGMMLRALSLRGLRQFLHDFRGPR